MDRQSKGQPNPFLLQGNRPPSGQEARLRLTTLNHFRIQLRKKAALSFRCPGFIDPAPGGRSEGFALGGVACQLKYSVCQSVWIGRRNEEARFVVVYLLGNPADVGANNRFASEHGKKDHGREGVRKSWTVND